MCGHLLHPCLECCKYRNRRGGLQDERPVRSFPPETQFLNRSDGLAFLVPLDGECTFDQLVKVSGDACMLKVFVRHQHRYSMMAERREFTKQQPSKEESKRSASVWYSALIHVT